MTISNRASKEPVSRKALLTIYYHHSRRLKHAPSPQIPTLRNKEGKKLKRKKTNSRMSGYHRVSSPFPFILLIPPTCSLCARSPSTTSTPFHSLSSLHNLPSPKVLDPTPPCTPPPPSTITRQAPDDDIKHLHETVDDCTENGSDGVDNRHEAGADGLEDGFDLL